MNGSDTTGPEIRLTCPCCGTGFTSPVAIEQPVLRVRSDLYRQAAGASQLAYQIHACPRCGFAGNQQAFARPTLSEAHRARVLRDLMPRVRGYYEEPSKPTGMQSLAALMPRCTSSVKDRVPGHVKYLCAAMVAEWLGESDSLVADYLLKAGWCAEEGGLQPRDALLSAVAHFERSLARQTELRRDQRATVAYLVGELYRRLGDPARANAWFSTVAREVVDPGEQSWLVDAARRQQLAPEDWL
ncbi:MAG: DUF2225 domain-containing protein [Candidatus Riflebacteria bacterium]|nr:DUF2225 domain-containing protein [Candidatus Riflebacteria bacterium]